jgi:hypothetical protein
MKDVIPLRYHLSAVIRAAHSASRGIYGARRIHVDLAAKAFALVASVSLG